MRMPYQPSQYGVKSQTGGAVWYLDPGETYKQKLNMNYGF